jgi:hypothetical protein
VTALLRLADGPAPEQVTPGFAGFVTMFLLAVGTILLIRSMVHHLRKVRYGPGPQGEPPDSERWNEPGRQVFDVREPQRPIPQPTTGSPDPGDPAHPDPDGT